MKFADREEYEAKLKDVTDILDLSDGHDVVKFYLEKENLLKTLPASRNVLADENLIAKVDGVLGAGRSKITW